MTQQQTLDYTLKYLKLNYGGRWNLEISDSKFYWNEDVPLVEIIVSSNIGHQGYLLVSTSKSTPFLITKAFNGDTLTQILLNKCGTLLAKGNISTSFLSSLKYYYDPPFNFIIRDETGLFIDINDNFILEKVKDAYYLKLPTENLNDIQKEWERLENPHVTNLDEEIIHRSGPRYNQAYNTNCEISGCSPVGWACYAGWLKMSGLLPELFSGSDDWYNDWPTYIFTCDTAEEQSKSVNELIWWFNSILGTSGGSTYSNNIIKGGAVFAKFGNPNIKVREFRDCTIQTITSLLRNYAILFSGLQEWQSVEILSPELKKKYESPAGHSVVCHGIKENEIYVNMGWGDRIGSRWYNLNSISQRHCLGLFS